MATLHGKIKEDILAKIRDGTYQEGDLIPTEAQLVQQYGVSRPTIRQALQALVDAGFLERRRRRGTVVKRPRSEQHYHHELRSYVDEMRDAGRVVSTTQIVNKRCVPPQGAIDALGLEEGEEAYKIVRLRYTDGKPMFLLETYVPCKLYPGLDAYDFNETGLYQAMSQCGNPVYVASSEMHAAVASDVVASLLDIKLGEPLFHYLQISRDEYGSVVEFTWSYYVGTIVVDETTTMY